MSAKICQRGVCRENDRLDAYDVHVVSFENGVKTNTTHKQTNYNKKPRTTY